MKKSNEIINHILSPYKEKINTQRCLKKIISLLPPKYNKYITSMTLKGEILFINVSHQAVKTELYYNRNLIFSIIKTMHSVNRCKDVNPSKIVTNYKYIPKPKKSKVYKFYIKPAGDFEIKAKKKEIVEKFEEIRKLLKKD